MPDYSGLKYLFTYATGNPNHYRSTYSPALIFACLDPTDTQFRSLETPQTLARHPLVKEVMGDTFFVRYFSGEDEQWHHNHGVQRWVFTLDISSVLRAMDAQEYDSVLLQLGGKPLGSITPRDILDECYLPHKYTMTCLDCATGTTKHAQSEHNCVLKNLLRRYDSGHVITPFVPSSCDLSDIREDHGLVNRETKIDKFVFVSPALTTNTVRSSIRPVHNHDFKGIQDASDERADAQHERRRFVRFQEEVCPTCSMHTPCRRTRSETSQRYCSGPYPPEKEIIDEILSNVTIPFSNAQLRTLLAHSGFLSKRYHRRIVSGTFGMDGNTLVYRIRRKTKPYRHDDAAQFNNYREAIKFLRKHNEEASSHYLPPMTRELKAVLCELASHERSPRNHYYWRTVEYPVLYIRCFGGVFRTTYSYHGRGTTGFGMEVRTLQDVYNHFERLSFGPHRKHELARSSRW